MNVVIKLSPTWTLVLQCLFAKIYDFVFLNSIVRQREVDEVSQLSWGVKLHYLTVSIFVLTKIVSDKLGDLVIETRQIVGVPKLRISVSFCMTQALLIYSISRALSYDLIRPSYIYIYIYIFETRTPGIT